MDYRSFFQLFFLLTDNQNLSIGKLYHTSPKKSLIFTIFTPKYLNFLLPFPKSYTNIPFASLSYPQNTFHIPYILTNQIRYNPCLLPISALFPSIYPQNRMSPHFQSAVVAFPWHNPGAPPDCPASYPFYALHLLSLHLLHFYHNTALSTHF